MGSRGWDILKGLWQLIKGLAWHAWNRDSFWKRPALILLAVLFIWFLLSGCASADFGYHWMKTRPAAPKPWLTVEVLDTDFTCRSLGADTAHRLERITGCAQWSTKGCTIYVPNGAPQFILEHEQKHCEGWTH